MQLMRSGQYEEDFDRILDYIANQNPSAAKAIALEIERHVRLLQEFPHLGRDGRVRGTRIGNSKDAICRRLFGKRISCSPTSTPWSPELAAGPTWISEIATKRIALSQCPPPYSSSKS
jgi:plasmid stabilization system protein ParE